MMTRSLPGPVNGLPDLASAPATMRKSSPNRVRSSRSQLPTSPAGGDDQDPSQEASGEHLADVEPGHDGLARPRLVGQQKAESGLGQHVVVDRDPLVGQRVDHRDLGREGGVEEMAVGRAARPRRRLGRPRGRSRSR